MVWIRKETSGVWREIEGVLLEVVELPIHKKTAVTPPALPPAVGYRSPILVSDVPSPGGKFAATLAVVAWA